MVKKILITGAQGYIGSILCRFLINSGFDVMGIDSGFFRDSVFCNDENNKVNFTLQEKDARDINFSDLAGVDAVVHLAGISNDPMGKMDPAQVYDPTREYAKSIAYLCRDLQIKFIFASSCSVYGIGNYDLLDESSKVNPQTGYSLNKWQIEQDLIKLSNENFSPIALRFATVFGPSPRIRFDTVINMFCGMGVADKRIILNSDGSAWRPNIHILDVCESIKRALLLDYRDGELLILNVGDDRNNLSIMKIAEIVRNSISGSVIEFMNKDANLNDLKIFEDRKVKNVDTRTYKVSFRKISQIFKGFQCKWTVEKGIQDMINWLNDQNLNSESLRDQKFYRLQHLENLLSNNLINNDLRWVNKISR